MHALDLFQLDGINTMGKSRGATPRINTDVSRLRWHEDEKIRSVEHENDRKNFCVRGWTAVPARKWREFRVLFQRQVTRLRGIFLRGTWWMEWKVTRKIVWLVNAQSCAGGGSALMHSWNIFRLQRSVSECVTSWHWKKYRLRIMQERCSRIYIESYTSRMQDFEQDKNWKTNLMKRKKSKEVSMKQWIN